MILEEVFGAPGLVLPIVKLVNLVSFLSDVRCVTLYIMLSYELIHNVCYAQVCLSPCLLRSAQGQVVCQSLLKVCFKYLHKLCFDCFAKMSSITYAESALL